MKLNHNIRFENSLKVVHQDERSLSEKVDLILVTQTKILTELRKLSPPDFSEQIKKLDEIINDVKTTV